MTRYAAALLIGFTFITSLSAEDAKGITLRWHGQSFFELITSKGTRRLRSACDRRLRASPSGGPR